MIPLPNPSRQETNLSGCLSQIRVTHQLYPIVVIIIIGMASGGEFKFTNGKFVGCSIRFVGACCIISSHTRYWWNTIFRFSEFPIFFVVSSLLVSPYELLYILFPLIVNSFSPLFKGAPLTVAVTHLIFLSPPPGNKFPSIFHTIACCWFSILFQITSPFKCS